MLPHMTKNEVELFLSFLRNTDNYVEFGCGASTELASCYVNEITSVDSDMEWIVQAEEACKGNNAQTDFIHISVGPIGEWGTPIDESYREIWSNYHTAVWSKLRAWDADFYLVDGRFRVACFAQICIHSRNSGIIALHDYHSRKKHYSIIEEIAKEIASVDDISFFIPRQNILEKSARIIERHKYDYK
jgi:hypothetical protein